MKFLFWLMWLLFFKKRDEKIAKEIQEKRLIETNKLDSYLKANYLEQLKRNTRH